MIQGPNEMFGARVTCDVKLSFPEGINVRFFFLHHDSQFLRGEPFLLFPNFSY